MEPTFRIQGRLGKATTKRARSSSHAAEGGSATLQPSRTLARRLALAHHIEALIDAGRLRNYAEAAAVLGVTRARLSQLMDLVLLPTELQEQILTDATCYSERELRILVRRHLKEID